MSFQKARLVQVGNVKLRYHLGPAAFRRRISTVTHLWSLFRCLRGATEPRIAEFPVFSQLAREIHRSACPPPQLRSCLRHACLVILKGDNTTDAMPGNGSP